MTLMVAFAIGDLSLFSPLSFLCFVHLGKSDGVLAWWAHIRFCGSHLWKGGMELVQKEACGTCVHMVLSCHCTNY
jgi:hypothetical protein